MQELVDYTAYIISELKKKMPEGSDFEEATQEVLFLCCKNWEHRNKELKLPWFINYQIKEYFRSCMVKREEELQEGQAEVLVDPSCTHELSRLADELVQAVKKSHPYVWAKLQGASVKEIAQYYTVSRQAVEKQIKIFKKNTQKDFMPI